MVSGEGINQPGEILGAPAENFAGGLLGLEIPELGPKKQGKVRDIWEVGDSLVMVTTDRQSAFDRMICTTPDKGQVLNLLSAFWFGQTCDIAPNHLEAIPHPDVCIAKKAHARLPVEIVWRRHMARSSTTTSVYHNYEQGRRTIYGLDFPDGLKPNQEFPMGSILTPTTKAETGHDQELTDQEAGEIVDHQLGQGMWERVKSFTSRVFERSRAYHLQHGLIMADTKYECGVDKNGQPMLIDEIHTPDSSRFWLAKTYSERFAQGADPEAFDKDILRRWLVAQGFRGEGSVPVVPPEVREKMAKAYKTPYRMITGKDLPDVDSSPKAIQSAILEYLKNNHPEQRSYFSSLIKDRRPMRV